MARPDPAPPGASPPSPTPANHQPAFAFALIGDVPYTPDQEPRLKALIDQINADRQIAFTIHDGDIKGGGQRCDNAVYQRELQRFSTFRKALVYTPGDNEWTDCVRGPAGRYDAWERLAHLRKTFFLEPSRSLGQEPIQLEHQGPAYPENARWQRDRITFATLHVVGSNNNRPSSLVRSGDEQEFRARNAANLEWLRSTFQAATEGQSAGVVLVMQANMLEGNLSVPSGFDELVTALREEVERFAKPVVLVHGDTHFFRIDQPRLGAGPLLENLTRVETFGDPDVGWVKVTVDPSSDEVFRFEEHAL